MMRHQALKIQYAIHSISSSYQPWRNQTRSECSDPCCSLRSRNRSNTTCSYEGRVGFRSFLPLHHPCKPFISATVIATASTKEKLDWLLSIQNGATHAINYRTEDFSEEVKKITDGKGVDIVIDFVGQSHWARNVEAMGYDGRMILLAALSGKSICIRKAVVPHVSLSY